MPRISSKPPTTVIAFPRGKGDMQARLEKCIFDTFDLMDRGEIGPHYRATAMSAIGRLLEHYGQGAKGTNDSGTRGSAVRRYAKAFRAKSNAPSRAVSARRDDDDNDDADTDDAA